MNTTVHRLPGRPTDSHTLGVRLGGQLAAMLSEQAQALPHDVTERLRFGRERAVARAREVRLAAAPAVASSSSVAGMSSRGVLTLGLGGGWSPWWQRSLSVLPLAMLVAGMVMIDRWSVREQIAAVAEVDSVLLADTLPPAAYQDPGFAEFLRSAPP